LVREALHAEVALLPLPTGCGWCLFRADPQAVFTGQPGTQILDAALRPDREPMCTKVWAAERTCGGPCAGACRLSRQQQASREADAPRRGTPVSEMAARAPPDASGERFFVGQPGQRRFFMFFLCAAGLFVQRLPLVRSRLLVDTVAANGRGGPGALSSLAPRPSSSSSSSSSMSSF